MLNKEFSQKIIDKVESLINKDIAILDLKNEVLSLSPDIIKENEANSIKDPLHFLDKRKLKNKDKTFSIVHKGQKVGKFFLDIEKSKISEIKDILKAVIELYLDQLVSLSELPQEDRYLDKFVYDLLYGKENSENLKDEADVFKIDFSIPRLAIVILIGGSGKEKLKGINITGEEKENYIKRTRRNISLSIDSFYTRYKDNIISYTGDNIFVVLKDIGGKDKTKENINHFKKTIDSLHHVIKDEVRNPITIGVGGFYEGMMGLRQSFGEALLTAHLGEDIWGSDKIYHFDNFGVIAPLIMGKDEKAMEYSRNFFAKFSNKEEVLKTLNTFFDTDMSLTETAKKLKIHRNTLVYRLDKINELLGLDPRIFDDAVQVRLAILFNNFLIGEAL